MGTLILALLMGSAAHAGPWTRDLGSAYTKVGADWFQADAYQVPGATEQATSGFLGRQYTGYLEAGLSPNHPVQLAAQLPIADSEVEFAAEDAFQRVEGTARTIRAGDLRLTPQVALTTKMPLAVAVEVKVPLYQVDSICRKPDQRAYRDICPRPGDGQIDITEWILAGAAQGPVFGEAWLGYMHRTEWFTGWDTNIELSDNIRWRLTGGVTLLDRFLIMAKGDAFHPVRSDGITPGWLNVGPAVLVDIAGGVAVEGRFARDLWATNTAPGTSFGFGLSWRR